MPPVNATLRNLVTNERGNVMMTFGLTSIIAVAAVGGAVDFGRAYQQKSRMQNALDAAVVSGVSKLKATGEWTQAETHAHGVFRAIFENALKKTTGNNTQAGLDQPIVQFQQVGTQIQGSVSMTANTPFMKLIIGQDLMVSASSSGAPPSGKQLEVALMVDVTGSMGWNAEAGATASSCAIVSAPTKKIDYLRCAGEDLLNILLPTSGANNSTVKIGVAPFADKVNAGEFATKVVDPVQWPAEGGTYVPKDNLAGTKQGPFSGSYSGANTTAGTQPTGAQYGSIGTTAPTGATNTSAGATYANTHCIPATYSGSPPTMGTRVVSVKAWNINGYGYLTGVSVAVTGSGAKPNSLLDANDSPYSYSYGRRALKMTKLERLYSYHSGWYWSYGTDGVLNTNGSYYAPVVTNANTATAKTYLGSPVGVAIGYNSSAQVSTATVPSGIVKNTSGYYKVTSYDSDTSTWNYTWVAADNSFYVRLYDGVETGYSPGTSGGTYSGCENASTTPQTSSSKLITCVTERMNGTALDYTADAIAAGRYVGPYNHGSSTKSNYSSDGKCYSAGRELPAIIPLTSNRETVKSFFETATVGGATAGHLGTAWASYLLSPSWSSIWPSGSAPSAYNSQNVMKAAILMTDGEYNIQFSMGGSSSNVSAKQALEICKQMRDNGVKVFTVGFGFGDNVTAPNVNAMTATQRVTPASSGTTQERAIDTLAKCATDNSSYYFPYDGEALRTVFKNIANSLSSDIAGGASARLTN